MLSHYIDLRLRPDPDFAPPLLLNALFSKLHRALVAHSRGDIGISFPGNRSRQLGIHLRLHGSEPALDRLMGQTWQSGMLDHVLIGGISAVPARAQHRIVRRVQAKGSADRLRRRQVRRHGLTEGEALERVPDRDPVLLNLPYVQLRSASTGQAFPLFIEHGPLLAEPRVGAFSAYGLSGTGTVPWF